jgi:outer membrane protein OmpA-like peptidoglycan-associated protein
MGAGWPAVIQVELAAPRTRAEAPLAVAVAMTAAACAAVDPGRLPSKPVASPLVACQRLEDGRPTWSLCTADTAPRPTRKTPATWLPVATQPARTSEPLRTSPDSHRPPPAEAAPISAVPHYFSAWSAYFGVGSAHSEDADAVAREAARRFLATPSARIVIVGMTDRSGAPALNAQLAHRRADSLRLRLLQAGVPAEAISMYADTSASRLPMAGVRSSPRDPGAMFRRADVVVRAPALKKEV